MKGRKAIIAVVVLYVAVMAYVMYSIHLDGYAKGYADCTYQATGIKLR